MGSRPLLAMCSIYLARSVLVKRLSRFQALLIEFGGIDIPLSVVAEKYLGLTAKHADNKAARHELPFKTYRAGSSQKAPRMVSVYDLASHLDGAEKRADAEYRALRG